MLPSRHIGIIEENYQPIKRLTSGKAAYLLAAEVTSLQKCDSDGVYHYQHL